MTPNVLIAAAVLSLLVLAFAAFFLAPGLLHWRRLRTLLGHLTRFEAKTPLEKYRRLFGTDKRLAHLWKEYQDSLHQQTAEREGQAPVVVAVRSTLPAETFFNSQYVVDSRLRTEFFKHLPGIFTGIGIIGTFSGLIAGLRQFQVSENAATVRASLEALMHSVGEAFLISAAAITAAMLVTFVEKLLLAALYGQAEEIAHAIDARFDAGAGEDYLSRLVKSSEESATQARLLKDALVKDLGETLLQLSRAQAQSARQDSQALSGALSEALGATIAASIEKSLRAPLQAVAETVKQASVAPNTHAAQTAQTVARLETLMTGFSQRLHELLGGQGAAVDRLHQQSAVTMQELRTVSAQMADNVQALTQATHSSLDKIGSGAERLGRASGDFASAGDKVGAVLGQAAALSSKLLEATGALNLGIAALQAGLDDHRSQRETVARLVVELRSLVDAVRKEASLSGEVLGRIEASTQRLGVAQQQAEQYLAGVNKVLGDAHQAFGSAVRKSLEVANAEFHGQLATAVGLLSATINELDATLGNALPPAAPALPAAAPRLPPAKE